MKPMKTKKSTTVLPLKQSQNSMLEDLLKSIEIPESQSFLGEVTQNDENPVPPPKLEEMEEPPYGVFMSPISLTGDFGKKLVMGYDLKTKAPFAYFKGEGKLSGRVRLTIDELFALLKDKTFNTIQNWFLGTDITDATLKIGGLEVTLYTAYHGGKSIKIQRQGNHLLNIFLAQSTWSKIGEHRDSIRMVHQEIFENSNFIQSYTEQFVEETVQNLTQQGMNYMTLVQTDIHSQQATIKKAMNSTSTHITAMHSQDMLMTLNVPILREQLKVTHYYFMKENVFKLMKNM
ncbi:hypothetical protein ONE63_000998 [Megalurothrips usitatus]|uniref:Band 7 domain-containing protein n=1 Tax=Megalurothrips usitatus TaxID=439358 RepID=A0AAV7XES3_9NEOP|nr:hypothetical protein ONE63_000998 [Megalurothrips usitatus]